MPEVVNYRFRLRRALKATWTAINDVLLDGEIGWARDTGEMKIGDGATGWNSLPYLERGIRLDRLGDVDAGAKADGKILKWDSPSGKHIYIDPPTGGGGPSDPFPPGVIHWLTVRHRSALTEAAPIYFANGAVTGVGLGAATTSSAGVVLSEVVNGLRGVRFGGVGYCTLSNAISLYSNTIIAVVKTPTAADWTNGVHTVWVGSANGSPQLRLDKRGTDSSVITVNRNQQVGIAQDEPYGWIPAGTVICITVTVTANNAVAIRRNGVQTAIGSGASFAQPLARWGARSSSEPTVAPLLEFVLFDRVLTGTDLTDAEGYLMGVWGIV